MNSIKELIEFCSLKLIQAIALIYDINQQLSGIMKPLEK